MSFPFIIFTTVLLTQQIVLSIPQPRGQRDHPLDSPDEGNDFIGGVARMSRPGISSSSPNSGPDDNDFESNLIPRHMEVSRDRLTPLQDDDQFRRFHVLRNNGFPPPPSSFRHSTRAPLPATRPRHSLLPTPPEFPTSFMNVRRNNNQDISSLVNSDYRRLHPDAPDDLTSRHADSVDSLPELVQNQRLPLAPFQRLRNRAPSVGDWVSRWLFRPILAPFGV